MNTATLQNLLNVHRYAVILSAENSSPLHSQCVKDKLQTINRRNTSHLEKRIKAYNLDYKPAKGYYHGSDENSFIVFCKDYFDVARVEILGLHNFKQECVIILDVANNRAILKDQNFTSIAGYGLVEKQSTENLENYSIIDERIYVIE